MKKIIHYFLYPFNRLYDLFYAECSDYEESLNLVHKDSVVYIVYGYYLNDEELDICAVCDDFNLCEDYVNQLRNLDKYYRFSIVDYTLNRLYII